MTDGEDADERGDWSAGLPLGDDGVRTSPRRQVGVIVAIVLATIVLLAGLIAAGAAVLRVVSDRASETSASYDFGHDLAEQSRDVLTQVNQPQDWEQTCRLLMEQADHRPQPFDLAKAVNGCVDVLSD